VRILCVKCHLVRILCHFVCTSCALVCVCCVMDWAGINSGISISIAVIYVNLTAGVVWFMRVTRASKLNLKLKIKLKIYSCVHLILCGVWFVLRVVCALKLSAYFARGEFNLTCAVFDSAVCVLHCTACAFSCDVRVAGLFVWGVGVTWLWCELGLL